jgi:hypothetical protein
MALSYRAFGVHDWAARLPLALSVVLLCFVTYQFGRGAFGDEAGLYSGLALATSCGLFLFTRILIPDAMLTLAITAAIWAWLRLLEDDEAHRGRWAVIMGVGLGSGLLLKGLIAILFPVLAGLAYMAAGKQLFCAQAWRRLRLPAALGVMLLIAAPWHILAAQRNPPFFSFSMHSAPGEYRGFFWFYFFNEHLLRFLNLRYPRDYNTVPRLWFWALNLAWLFPWSAFLPAALKLTYGGGSRAERARVMAVCWVAVVMVFFSFSTTQEYYSMPIYPALALLIGAGLASGARWLRAGKWLLMAISASLAAALATVLVLVRKMPAPGDISQALTHHPEMYTLSLGHLSDLTLAAFAYLKLPLALAEAAFAFAVIGLLWPATGIRRRVLGLTVAMIIFFQAARVALIRFDPYLGSYALAQRLNSSPPGGLIEADAYYAFSSVFFYSDRKALLLNGRFNNLEYGSYAPDAPQVFIDDAKFILLWNAPRRYYLLAYGADMPHLEQLVGREKLHQVAENGGNYLLTNQSLP